MLFSVLNFRKIQNFQKIISCYCKICTIKTAEIAKELKDKFYEERYALYKEYREVTRAKGTQSCSDMTDKPVALRLSYMEKITKLVKDV